MAWRFFGSGKSHLLKILFYLEVFETLDVYDFKEKIKKNIIEEFDNLYNRVESANSFAILSSMSDLSEKVDPVPEVVIKTKMLSMREFVKGQKTIKNNEDIDAVVESLRRKLKEELEKDTIISLILNKKF